MKGTVKVQMFNLPNFLRIEGLSGDGNVLDVATLFPSDDDARIFWQDCQSKWIEHVAKRRASLGKEGGL